MIMIATIMNYHKEARQLNLIESEASAHKSSFVRPIPFITLAQGQL